VSWSCTRADASNATSWAFGPTPSVVVSSTTGAFKTFHEFTAIIQDDVNLQFAGGTPAIQRVRIASEIFGRSFDQRPPRVVS